MSPLGHRTWAFTAGYLPDGSTGREPDMTSRDELCVLNTGGKDASVSVTVYYGDAEPVGRYRLVVPAGRVRHLRVNGLFDPLPVPLDTPHGVVVKSDVPVIVQLRHVDSRQAELALAVSTAIPLS